MSKRARMLRLFRKLHLTVGLVAALYFLFIALTGVAINHREGWRLEERVVSRGWLPDSYRPQDGGEVRMDIVLTDLHSGLLFGRVGAPLLDVVAAVWLFSILSGLTMLALRTSLHRRPQAAVHLSMTRKELPVAARPTTKSASGDD
jgi:uncharacterized iron-regulated membrane protein